MKAKVYVTYKPGVLDPQGQTVSNFLRNRGEARVRDVRIGKFIEFELDDMPGADAQSLLEEISHSLLANPIIETFRVEVP
ncbi:MAG: phosphoribosylformylglycinamidine synthase subunit PurS [Calditrichota bacterium]